MNDALAALQRLRATRTRAVAGVLRPGAGEGISAGNNVLHGAPPPRPDMLLVNSGESAPGRRDARLVLVERKEAEARAGRKYPTEARRILALPAWDFARAIADAAPGGPLDMTARFRAPGGTMVLKPIQNLALHWIAEKKGLVGPIAVGGGKTIIALLAAEAMGAQRPILFIPPALQIPLRRAMEKLAVHWRLPRNLHIVPYSKLSVASSTAMLEQLRPDLIIADEAHMIRNPDSARTKRVLRYFRQFPTTRLVALSGTLTSKSLRDYCLSPGTRVLTSDLRWVPVEDVRTGDSLVGFDEKLGRGKFSTASVEGVRRIKQPRMRIVTNRGTVTCSTLHGWVLCARAGWRHTRRWITAEEVRPGDELAFFVEPWKVDTSWEGGYLAGLLDGEGWITKGDKQGTGRGQVGFGQKPGPVLDAYRDGLRRRGFTFSEYTAKSGVVRIIPNGEAPHIRLVGMLRPRRLLANADRLWEGKAMWGRNTERAVVRSVERLEEGPVIAVQTSTSTLVAEGFLTHNSHLCELALRDGSPLPTEDADLIAWANCIDSRGMAQDKDWSIFAAFSDLRGISDDGERRDAAREVFRQRFVTTPGVVATTEASVQCSILFHERKVAVPRAVQEAIADLHKTWCRPDGEEMDSALALWRLGMQLSQGFYLRWVWPGGVPDREWLEARAQWHREIRYVLQGNQTGLDSPFLVKMAVLRGHLTERPIARAWEAWDRVRHRPEPPTETVWIDDYLVRDALAWRAEHPRGIIWHSDLATEAALRAASVPTYGRGEVPALDGSRGGMALSVRVHGTGLDGLQFHHDEMLFLAWPSSGEKCEQVIGRLHRDGQEADEVGVWRYEHVPDAAEAVVKSRENARYLQDTMGSPMKLCYGVFV